MKLPKYILAFLMDYSWNALIWLTQGINTILLAGHPDESTSSRCWRLRDRQFWKQLRIVVDFILGEGHCQEAYEEEARKVAAWLR